MKKMNGIERDVLYVREMMSYAPSTQVNDGGLLHARLRFYLFFLIQCLFNNLLIGDVNMSKSGSE